MDPNNQVIVVADVSRNVLKLSFTGEIRAIEMSQYEEEIARALPSLRPGFSLLTDFTEMVSMELECIPYLERTMDTFRNSGVKLVVRIIPDRAKDIGIGILSLFHYPHGIRIVTTESQDEAHRVFP
jgi:hypothetical protein